jgi:hypothetical protein
MAAKLAASQKGLSSMKLVSWLVIFSNTEAVANRDLCAQD